MAAAFLKRALRLGLVVATILAVSACGDDGSEPDVAVLQDAEAEASSGAESLPEAGTGTEGTQESDGPASLPIVEANVDADNSYSSGFGPQSSIDGNESSYWSSRDLESDIGLDYRFDRPRSVSGIRLLSLRDEGSYTQPDTIRLIFLDESGESIEQFELDLDTPSTAWITESFSPVADVLTLRLEVAQVLDDEASWVTINEVEIYGN